jgi:uncharacterized protein (DUF362 family)
MGSQYKESHMPKPKVAIVKGKKNPDAREIESMVRKAVALAGGINDIVSPGGTVIIKPNLVAALPARTGATTDYRVCRAVARMVKELGGRPVIMESSCIGADTEKTFRVCAYDKLRGEGYEVIDAKTSKMVTVPVPQGRVLTEVLLPEMVMKAQAIISVPVMKTHDQCLATLSLKNMKGLLTDAWKKKFHTIYGVFQAVADLCTVVKPTFTVVDGLVGQEGLGPVYGIPVGMGLIIAGKDPVAVDSLTSMVMGMKPEEVETTKFAAGLGLGIMEPDLIDVVGVPVASVRRRFKLGCEAVSESVPFPEGFELIFNEKACTGCRNGVLSVVRDLNAEGKMHLLQDLRAIAGQIDTKPAGNKKTLLVGVCTAPFKDYGVYVKGCCPNNVDIAAAIASLSGPEK